MPYCFPGGQSAADLVRQLAEQDWWGEIVGPHGSGKSSLLATLVPQIRAAGRAVHCVALHDGQRRLPRGFLKHSLSLWERVGVREERLLAIDGYEQLAPWWRWWLRLTCRRAGAGLLITSHAPAGLPPLVCTAPDLRLVEQLVDMLQQHVPSPVTERDIVASHACHGSNVREILFDLYDRHEQRMRAMRTRAACGT